MKALLLATIITALKAYAGSGVFSRIASLVFMLSSDSAMSGADKMKMVVNTMKNEAAELGETLIRAVAEVVLLKLKG